MRHGSRWGAVAPYRSRSARRLFVIYDRKATRINGNPEGLISNVIGCRAGNRDLSATTPNGGTVIRWSRVAPPHPP